MANRVRGTEIARQKALGLLTGIVLVISGCSLVDTVQSHAQRPIYEPIPADAFVPVERPEMAHPTPEKKSIARAQPDVDTGGPGGGNSVRGQASWYCSSTSACHHSYPGGLYAAAGPALRVGNWRGRTVTVCGAGNCVNVKLIDFCACSSTRVIDLYSDAFRRLTPLSSGVVRVTVSW